PTRTPASPCATPSPAPECRPLRFTFPTCMPGKNSGRSRSSHPYVAGRLRASVCNPTFWRLKRQLTLSNQKSEVNMGKNGHYLGLLTPIRSALFYFLTAFSGGVFFGPLI